VTCVHERAAGRIRCGGERNAVHIELAAAVWDPECQYVCLPINIAGVTAN
jgi:hypothetical protein